MGKLGAKKLTSEQIEEIVAAKLRWILGCCEPEFIYLFGSAACEEMTTASDIDLIVVFSDESLKKKVQKDLFKARPSDDWPHDLLLYSLAEFEASCKKGGGVCWLAQREGKLIYQKANLSKRE